jgi:hypothetical protein
VTAFTGSTPYETWVVTLRAWSTDPQTPLGHLPVLSEDEYTPDTFTRLIAELSKAMQAISDRWLARLAMACENSQTPHDLARELVSLRGVLARRGQLATHPSLPKPIKDGLQDGFRRDVENWQSEVEESIGRAHSRDSLDTTHRDLMLQVVRENSLLAVLGYDYGSASRAPALVALPERDRSLPLGASTARSALRRRVVPIGDD